MKTQLRKMLFESLEHRLLLASDFLFDGNLQAPQGYRATLSVIGSDLVLRENLSNVVLQSLPLVDFSGNVIITGSSQDDSLTIASISAQKFSFNGLGGTDEAIVSGGLSLSGGDLSLNAESILVNAGATIAHVDNVTLTALANDVATVSSLAALVPRTATIVIEGSIQATGDVKLTSDAVRNVNISLTSVTPLNVNSSNNATVELRSGANVTAATTQIRATTSGTVIAENTNGVVANVFGENAKVLMTGANFITATSLDVRAETKTIYAVTGRDASNEVTGDAIASAVNRTLNAGVGGLSLVALDTSILTSSATAPSYNLDLVVAGAALDGSQAKNRLTRSVEAFSQNSTLAATNGNIMIDAHRDARLTATVRSCLLEPARLEALRSRSTPSDGVLPTSFQRRLVTSY